MSVIDDLKNAIDKMNLYDHTTDANTMQAIELLYEAVNCLHDACLDHQREIDALKRKVP